MPYVVEFEWKEDEEFGGEGWILKQAPHFNADSRGIAIAHDVLEHFQGRYHGIEDEMLAFGSILFMRAEGGWFYHESPFVTPAENMMSDIYRFVVEEHRCKVADRRARRLDPDSEPEYLIRDMEKAFWHLWETEGDYGEPHTMSKEDGAEALRRAMNWIRTGYRKAVKRWGRFPEHWADFFSELVRELDTPKYRNGEWGQTLRVSVNIKESTFDLKVLDDEDEY